jgi:hypothetical protein
LFNTDATIALLQKFAISFLKQGLPMPIQSMAEIPDTSSQGTMAGHFPLDMRTEGRHGL